MAITNYGPISWERMIGAVEEVQRRLERAVGALEGAGVPYAVIGGNAVAAWVSKVDPSAVRITPNVDFLIHRSDFELTQDAFNAAEFRRLEQTRLVAFADAVEHRYRGSVRLVFANERVLPADLLPTPDLRSRVCHERFDVIAKGSLIEMKLTAFRTIDRVHLRDMIEVGAIDRSHTDRLPKLLFDRLQTLIDNPDA